MRKETQPLRQVRTDLDLPSALANPPRSSSSPTLPWTRSACQQQLAELLQFPSPRWRQREEWQRSIATHVLENSSVMDGHNFRRVSRQDLERMAEAYDRCFFNGRCLPLARSYGMSFRLSSRMSRAGGKTTRRVHRAPAGRDPKVHYEIALSTSLLFQSFRKPGDRTRVCGLVCSDRLTAMQRVVEHELIHLCEMLVWIQSDCAATRFQTITHRLFGHTEHRHQLVTQQERADRDFDIQPGKRVTFRLDGQQIVGIVNRITSRATVLVPDPKGARYNDGGHYSKYYVPLDQLRPID